MTVSAYREASWFAAKLTGVSVADRTSPTSSASTSVLSGRMRYLPRPMNSARTFCVRFVSRLKTVVRFVNVGTPIVLM